MGKSRETPEVSAGSMADIAFLLLVFFLVTTTIASDKGVSLLLPPKDDEDKPETEIKENKRNVFNVLVNSSDKLLVEDEPLEDVYEIKDMAKKFILNFGTKSKENMELIKTLAPAQRAFVETNGRDPESSDNPTKAVVSFKADRGTSYKVYIQILDQLQAAYYEVYAERVGMSTDDYRALDRKDPKQAEIYDRGREGIPMNISIAEPTKIGG